jgi:hypothetical protein
MVRNFKLTHHLRKIVLALERHVELYAGRNTRRRQSFYFILLLKVRAPVVLLYKGKHCNGSMVHYTFRV